MADRDSKSVTVHTWSNFRQMSIVEIGRLEWPVLLFKELKENPTYSKLVNS